MQPTIRLAKLEDAPGVVATVKEVYDEYDFTWEAEGYHSDLYDLTAYCDPQLARFWVAERNGEVVGCGGVRYFPAVAGPLATIVIQDDYERIAGATCDIARMYVRPSARNLGIASSIMKLIVEHATGPIEIWSDKRFVDAHRLYQRFGAKVVGERICHDPDQAPEWGLLLIPS